MTERARGHTLVEVIVALGLAALLLCALMGYLRAGLGALERGGQALSAQRSLRRALAELDEDLLEMGCRVPCRAEATPALFQLAKDRPVRSLAGKDGAPGSGLRTDELSLRKDVFLPGGVVLAAPVLPQEPAAPQAWVDLTAERNAALHPGDLVLVEDGRWEGGVVAEPATLSPGRTVAVRLSPLAGPPVFSQVHDRGAPAACLHPLRLIQYRLALLPGRGTALVRLETDGPARFIAEGITRFEVDLPLGAGDPVPPLVRVTLEARRGSGPRREATLVRAPRNGPGRPL